MGNNTSSMASSRVTKKKKQQRRKHRPQCRRGMFNHVDGRNYREDHAVAGPYQWVTVFFNWADRRLTDEELMDLVLARIHARDGIISSRPVHHDVKFCLSLPIPELWQRTDIIIVGGAQNMARWYKEQIQHAGMRINRQYLFRAQNRKDCCYRKAWRSGQSVDGLGRLNRQ
ncbi:uncharacterized protein N7515_007577 [Penicillium bovifimosum]|uniref:Uncharacterized protein n=1 Tax=Penicillium bovifimosum TaxID=126998 RepID=A0A9W9L0U6_9EURO|nr:uncharacterized protein N7515_007577 [Penicillium bovifimosum]KAJ5131538.1 hypothetical protein N7515_007577 [Penicillium bovifimosum]